MMRIWIASPYGWSGPQISANPWQLEVPEPSCASVGIQPCSWLGAESMSMTRPALAIPKEGEKQNHTSSCCEACKAGHAMVGPGHAQPTAGRGLDACALCLGNMPCPHATCSLPVRLLRPLDPLYAERWQSTAIGARGGLEVRPPFKRHVAVSPEEFHADYNAWYDIHGHVATTERLKPAAFFAKNAEILRKVNGAPLVSLVCAGLANGVMLQAACSQPQLAGLCSPSVACQHMHGASAASFVLPQVC